MPATTHSDAIHCSSSIDMSFQVAVGHLLLLCTLPSQFLAVLCYAVFVKSHMGKPLLQVNMCRCCQGRCYICLLTPWLTGFHVLQTLCEETNGEAIITTGVGQHQMWAAQWYNYNEPRRWASSGGLGSMGFGLPSALGAAVAYDGTDSGRPKKVPSPHKHNTACLLSQSKSFSVDCDFLCNQEVDKAVRVCSDWSACVSRLLPTAQDQSSLVLRSPQRPVQLCHVM